LYIMFVFEEHGAVLSNGASLLRVDPSRKRLPHCEGVFVTHAHSDHAFIPRRSATSYFMSPETADLLGVTSLDHVYPITGKMDLAGFDIRFEHAGHILGSRQVVFSNGLDIVVTGDIKVEDDLICKGAKPIHADILVIESTFGSMGC